MALKYSEVLKIVFSRYVTKDTVLHLELSETLSVKHELKIKIIKINTFLFK